MRSTPTPEVAAMAQRYASQYGEGYAKHLRNIGLSTRLHLASEYVKKMQPWADQSLVDAIAHHLFNRSL